MSSYDGWLPPLTSHEPHQSHTTVDISQCRPQTPKDRSIKIPELAVCFEANIYFISNKEEEDDDHNSASDDEEEQDRFFGLCIDESWETSCSSEHAIGDILELFPYLASDEGGQIIWKEMLYRGEESCSELSKPNEIAEKFSGFLSGMMKTGLSRYVIDVRIDKEIVIPKEDLQSWLSWYDEKKKSDPDGFETFNEAISRPRTRDELLNETAKPRRGLGLSSVDLDRFEASEAEKVSAESCIFCMDMLSNDSKATKLPACGHVFHRNCLEMWLRDSNECPICRSQVLPTPLSTD